MSRARERTNLMTRETQSINDILAIPKREMLDSVKEQLDLDLETFQSVRGQLLSLLTLWNRVVSGKVRYDTNKGSIKSMDLDPLTVLMECEIIPARGSIGLSFCEEEHLTDLVFG